jgi:phage/plasmid-like protein (TIGR03299 family)
MAHQLDTISRATVSYASTRREWHGLGQLMPIGATVEEWQKAANMDYKIQRARIRYATEMVNPTDAIGNLKTIDEKLVLFRSDTGAALSVVSDSYKVVQPAEVLELFREWAAAGGVTIESAGVLFGGKRYFATAKLSETMCLDGTQDKMVLYALFSTSADGSLASEVRLVTVRVVCNNTLRLALNTGAAYRVTHRSVFSIETAKSVIEAANSEFSSFMDTARALAKMKMEQDIAEAMTVKLLAKASDEVARESAAFTKIMALFNGDAKGSNFETAHETAWGWLNAVTEYADHHVRARTDENRQASALWGPGDALKQKAVTLLTA